MPRSVASPSPPSGRPDPIGGHRMAGPTLASVRTEDPFGREILADPLEFQEQLREEGDVVLLERYDVYAMGRYDTVRAALLDWQAFESGAGVGLSDFRREPP